MPLQSIYGKTFALNKQKISTADKLKDEQSFKNINFIF